MKRGVNERLRQWAEYEAQLEKLINWLGDSEVISPKIPEVVVVVVVVFVVVVVVVVVVVFVVFVVVVDTPTHKEKQKHVYTNSK